MSSPGYTVGIDIGGTKIAAAVVADGSGEVIGLHQTPTPARDGPDAVIDAAVTAARRAIAVAPGAVGACGIGTAGTVDAAGTVTHATDALPGWAGTDLTERFSRALAMPVTVLNDVHAIGVGEARHGAAAGCRDAFVIAIGTGIGAAIVHDGRVITGASGMAGSIGHVSVDAPMRRRCSCGRWNHLEAYACGPAIEAQHAAATGETIPLPEIAARARAGDEAARAIIAAAAGFLGRSLAQVATLLDPDVIVITGGVASLHDLIASPLHDVVASRAMPGPNRARLRFSRLGTRATILGAASAARAARRGP
jgi:glucokinase